MRIEEFVPNEIKMSEKAVHGGDVWAFDPRKVIDFSSNINPLGPSTKAVAAVKKSLWKIPYYPESNPMELKSTISKYMGVEKENICLGNGSTEIIKNFCDVFLQKNDRVIISEPTFSEYEVYCKLNGAKIKHVYAKEEENFKINSEKIIEEIDEKTRALFLCNPNNPTGSMLSRKEIIDIIRASLNNECLVFIDEAYIEFTGQEGFCKNVGEFENLMILRSMTKFFSLPGLRVGYGVGNKAMIQYLEKVSVPWGINAIAQTAAISSLKDREFIRQSKAFIRKEKDFLYEKLIDMALKIYNSDANFFLINLKEVNIKAVEAKRMLIESGVLIRDCTSFRSLGGYFIRVCVRRREENLKLLRGLREMLEGKKCLKR